MRNFRKALLISITALSTLGALNLTAGPLELIAPTRIAQLPDGNLAVCESRQNAIVIYSPALGEVIGGFKIKGQPLSFAYAKGRFYVGNATTGRLEVYDRIGTWLYNLDPEGVPIRNPLDIDIDIQSNRIAVVDGEQKYVRLYSLAGKRTGTIPSTGPDPSLLYTPKTVLFDPANQEIYVSDYGHTGLGETPRIQVFNDAGIHQRELLAEFESSWSGTSYTYPCPQGMAFDGNGRLLVVDFYRGMILVRDRTSGELLETLGTLGENEGELLQPYDVAIDTQTQQCFVTCNRTGKIETFTIPSL